MSLGLRSLWEKPSVCLRARDSIKSAFPLHCSSAVGFSLSCTHPKTLPPKEGPQIARFPQDFQRFFLAALSRVTKNTSSWGSRRGKNYSVRSVRNLRQSIYIWPGFRLCDFRFSVFSATNCLENSDKFPPNVFGTQNCQSLRLFKESQ